MAPSSRNRWKCYFADQRSVSDIRHLNGKLTSCSLQFSPSNCPHMIRYAIFDVWRFDQPLLWEERIPRTSSPSAEWPIPDSHSQRSLLSLAVSSARMAKLHSSSSFHLRLSTSTDETSRAPTFVSLIVCYFRELWSWFLNCTHPLTQVS